MPRPNALLHAGRFFARVDRFLAECPKCSTLLIAALDSRTRRNRQRTAAQRTAKRSKGGLTPWNPVTQQLYCSNCEKTWAVGLVLYEVRHRNTAQAPADTKPTWHQLLAIREQYAARGFLADRPIGGADEVNQAVCVECTCPRRGWDTACAIHGIVAQRERQAAEPKGGSPHPPTSTEPPEDESS